MGIFKNLFFKKKNSSERTVNKVYTCIGIQYFNAKKDAEDDIAEAFYDRLSKKQYTDTDLDTISEKAFLNCRECFYWSSGVKYDNTEVSNVYKFISVKDHVDDKIKTLIESSFSELKPYTRKEIQDVKMELQYEIWDNCNFKPISKVSQFINGEVNIYYLRSS